MSKHYTFKHWLARARSGMNQRSKRRGHELPTFTMAEFRSWTLSQENFLSLWDAWAKEGCPTRLIPSVDRLHNNFGYTLDNMQILPFHENQSKDATNNSQSSHKSVKQLTMTGEYIATFNSIMEASRVTGATNDGITRCCNGTQTHARKFLWVWSI